MASSLPTTTKVLLDELFCEISKDGKLASIQEKWLGFSEDVTFESETMTIKVITYPYFPWVYRDDNGEWVGIHIDLMNAIKDIASKDGVELIFDVDYDES